MTEEEHERSLKRVQAKYQVISDDLVEKTQGILKRDKALGNRLALSTFALGASLGYSLRWYLS